MYASTERSKHARVHSLANELYRDHHSQLLRIALSNAATRADGEEALQEAFLSFIEHFDPSGPAPALPWLILTLKRACWAKGHRAHYDLKVSLDASTESAAFDGSLEAVLSREADEEFGERIDLKLDARGAMASLKPNERTALLLAGLGFSYGEIASSRGWTYTKVNRCINEGRATLRRSVSALAAEASGAS